MAVTPQSMADVQHRFSHADAAGKWDAMYSSETEQLDEANFRLRRNITVTQVLRMVNTESHVLDLGCGTAPVLSKLRRYGVKVSGLDYSADMLEHARSRLRSLGLDDTDLQQGDCRATPYPAASFDVIVCLGVISYIENYDAVLDEIDRLLKPGGRVLISFRNVFNPVFSDPVRLLKQSVKKLLGRSFNPRLDEPFVIGRFLDFHSVNEKMEARRFDLVDFFGIGFGPFCFSGKKLFSESRSIRLSRWLTQVFDRLVIHRTRRWLTDVSLWVYQKPYANIL